MLAASGTAGHRPLQVAVLTAWASSPTGSVHRAAITLRTVFSCVASRKREKREKREKTASTDGESGLRAKSESPPAGKSYELCRVARPVRGGGGSRTPIGVQFLYVPPYSQTPSPRKTIIGRAPWRFILFRQVRNSELHLRRGARDLFRSSAEFEGTALRGRRPQRTSLNQENHNKSPEWGPRRDRRCCASHSPSGRKTVFVRAPAEIDQTTLGCLVDFLLQQSPAGLISVARGDFNRFCLRKTVEIPL